MYLFILLAIMPGTVNDKVVYKYLLEGGRNKTD